MELEPRREIDLRGKECPFTLLEIGEALSMPTATVKSHLHRARQRLKAKLEPVISEDWSRLGLLSDTA